MIYLKLFLTFFKIGALTFGGGYAMLPFIEQEVLKNSWLTMEQLVDFIAVSESTPGPFAINMATYIGTETAGIGGAACATMGVVLPSFIVILTVAKLFTAFQSSKIVKGMMSGLRPAVVGLIAAAVVSIGGSVFFPSGFSFGTFTTYAFLTSLAIFAIMIVLAFRKINPIFIILLSAGLGIAVGYAGELFMKAA